MVSATSGTTGGAATVTPTVKDDTLGRDAFLKLLVTQLKNQDPLKPMSNEQFIAQLAQFSSLEQMQQVNANLGLLNQSQATFQQGAVQQGVALIGKTVEAINPDYVPETDPASKQTLRGKVGSLDLTSGQPILMVGDKAISLESVPRVFE